VKPINVLLPDVIGKNMDKWATTIRPNVLRLAKAREHTSCFVYRDGRARRASSSIGALLRQGLEFLGFEHKATPTAFR
jgi:hypothetical protein